MSRSRRVEELYQAALERPVAERETFLAEACVGDRALLSDVKSLLGYVDEARRLLDVPAAEAATARLAVTPGARLGRYEVVERIGAGGMGEVYRARDTRLGRDVALKVLPAEQSGDEEARRRFEQEARAIASLSHPHVCALYDVGRHEDVDYLVMELLEGETLAERLSRGPPGLDEALEAAQSIAAALEAAHAQRIVHRDLKPANVHVSTGGHVKVMDFGLARALPGAAVADDGATQPGTRAGVILGTAAYMSPEQARGRLVDARADLWALGCVLYETLTGKRAFPGETVSDTLAAVLDRDPDWAALPEATPAQAQGVLRRCLQKDPAGRPGDATSVREELQRALATTRSGARAGRAGGEERPPYPGLASFSEADAERFFGREAEVEALWSKLRRQKLLGLIGPSGAGKTSFLHAGLVPSRPQGWGAVVCRPGDAPLLRLGQALAPHVSDDTESLRALIGIDDPEVALDVLGRWRRRHDEALLIVDAFEELFAQNPPEAQARFAALLGRLAHEADVHVLVSMRDDFLFQCHAHDALAPLFDGLTPLGPPGGSALRRAVVRPAEGCGYRFEDEALVDELLEGMSDERGALPLLAFAMARLWERRDRDRRLLTREAYADIGGVGGALAQHAEATLGRLGTERQALVREIFRNLITSQGTRAARDVKELLSVFPDRGKAEPVLRELIGARLLTSFDVPGAEGEPERRRVEIVHESLLRAWPRLVRWQAQDADGAQLRDQLRQAARLWEERGRPDDLLWTGTSFREYAVWRERYAGGLTAGEEAFGRAMRADATRRRRRRRAVYAAALAVLATGLAVTGLLWRQARLEALRAEASRLVTLGESAVETDATAALAYATRSLELVDTRDARLLALRILQQGPVARIVRVAPEDDAGEHVFDLDFSPDGEWLATGGRRKSTIVHRGGGRRQILGEYASVAARPIGVAFSSAGDAVIGNLRGDIRAWSVPGGSERRWDRAEAGPSSLVMDDDGFLTFTRVGDRQVIRRWPLAGGESERVGTRDRGVFGATPRALAFARDRQLFLRDLDDWSAPPRAVATLPADVVSVALSRAGDRLAAVDRAGTIRVWDTTASAGEPARVFEANQTRGLRFDPSGRWLSAGGLEDGVPTIRLWDLEAFPEAGPLVLSRSTNVAIIGDIAFDPASDWLASAYAVSIAWWWRGGARAQVIDGHRSAVTGLAFTPDGRSLVSSSRDGTVRLWPLEVSSDRRSKLLLRAPPGGAPAVSVDPRGRFAAVPGAEGPIHIVPLDGSPPWRLEGFSDRVTVMAAVFSEDGRLVAAAPNFGPPEEMVVRVWDLETGDARVFGPLSGASDGRRLAFVGPDEILAHSGEGLVSVDLVTGDLEVVARWPGLRGLFVARGRSGLANRSSGTGGDLAHSIELIRFTLDGRPPVRLRSGVPAAALDAGGSLLVTGSTDGTVHVGPASGAGAHLLLGHRGLVRSVAISPDGRWLASGAEDKTIRLWPMPDVSRTPFHELPLEELLPKLRTHTNLRAVRDAAVPSGYRLEPGPFPGWASSPEW